MEDVATKTDVRRDLDLTVLFTVAKGYFPHCTVFPIGHGSWIQHVVILRVFVFPSDTVPVRVSLRRQTPDQHILTTRGDVAGIVTYCSIGLVDVKGTGAIAAGAVADDLVRSLQRGLVLSLRLTVVAFDVDQANAIQRIPVGLTVAQILRIQRNVGPRIIQPLIQPG